MIFKGLFKALRNGMTMTLLTNINKLVIYVGENNKLSLLYLLFLMFLNSFFEILGVGLIFPFLSVLVNQSVDQPYYSHLRYFSSYLEVSPLTFITALFCTAILLACLFRVYFLWFSTNFSYRSGSFLSQKIYKLTLFQPYSFHQSVNTSKLIDVIAHKTDAVISGVMMPLIILINSCVVGFIVFVLIASIKPEIALSVCIFFFAIYFPIVKLTRARLIINSQTIAVSSSKIIKLLQEGFGGIRDVLVNGTQKLHSDLYNQAVSHLRESQAQSVIIAGIPRYLVEAIGLLLLAVMAYSYATDGEIYDLIPVVGVFALAGQRLLPIIQQAYVSWTNIKVGQSSLVEIIGLLEQPAVEVTEACNLLAFNSEIRFDHISYGYTPQKKILNNFNLVIPKGARVGISGRSGSGKSTFLDLLMGLLVPDSGEMLIDEVSLTKDNMRGWQKNIAHVPQTIFLMDDTIIKNIVFGADKKFDLRLFNAVVRSACLDEFVLNLPHGYETIVGERGVRLSGGQKQRIGIARALYKNPSVLILDEATSALDGYTENLIVDSIKNLSTELTIIVVAHRLNTLNFCNIKIDFNDL